MDHMTTEFVVPLSNHASLDSLISTIARILQSYRTVRLEIEGRQLKVAHLGSRNAVIDTLTALIDKLEMRTAPWCGNILASMFQVTRAYNGYVISHIFTSRRQTIYDLLMLNKGEELAHVMGAGIVEDDYLRDHQLMLGLSPTYQSTIGQLREIVLIELPTTEEV